MITRLLMALAVLGGEASDGMSRGEAQRLAAKHGLTRFSSGRVRRALNLRGRPAFNEYRSLEKRSFDRAPDPSGIASDFHVGMRTEWADEHRQNRNAAKARRRALRSSARA